MFYDAEYDFLIFVKEEMQEIEDSEGDDKISYDKHLKLLNKIYNDEQRCKVQNISGNLLLPEESNSLKCFLSSLILDDMLKRDRRDKIVSSLQEMQILTVLNGLKVI